MGKLAIEVEKYKKEQEAFNKKLDVILTSSNKVKEDKAFFLAIENLLTPKNYFKIRL